MARPYALLLVLALSPCSFGQFHYDAAGHEVFVFKAESLAEAHEPVRFSAATVVRVEVFSYLRPVREKGPGNEVLEVGESASRPKDAAPLLRVSFSAPSPADWEFPGWRPAVIEAITAN